MADYYVWVRDYHWSHHNIVVQSPILDPNAPAPTPIVRPLEGANRNEPRVIDSVAELRDDINKNEYETEAHGVLVSTDPRKPSRFPVWVPVQSYRVKEDEVDIVNLISFTVSNVPIGQICWIPGWEGPGGKLYTVIGAPRLTLRETRVLVLVQSLGRPREAKFVMVKPDELAGYEEIREPRKKRLVEMQSWFIQTRSNPPSTIALNAYRIYCSPYRDNEDRLAFDEILGEDLEDHRSSYSDCSSRSTRSTSCSFSDDGSLYTKPSYPRLVATKRSYNCDCKHAGLFPTRLDPRPSHRHGTDEECSLGSAHTQHCIFADHSPNVCVLSRPGEQHQHCVPPPQDLEAELKKLCGENCFDDAEALHREADRGVNNIFGSMDLELSHVTSPSIAPQPAPSLRTGWVSTPPRNKRKCTKRLRRQNLDPATKPVHSTAWNARINYEAFRSPEPQDMEF